MAAGISAFKAKIKEAGRGAVVRKLLGNFLSLSFMQFVSNLVHLVTIPHIVTAVGYERYGIIAVAFALTQYLITFTDYGFNLTATKEISVSRHSSRRIGHVVSNVFAAKVILMLAGFIFLCLLTAAMPRWRLEWAVFLGSYTIVVGQVLYPLWYFQGVELMRVVTIFNVLTRFLYAIMVFTLINGPDDYVLVNFYNGICHIITGTISLGVGIFRFGLRLHLPNLKGIMWAFRASWHTFVSYFLNNIFVNSYVIILNLIAGDRISGQLAVVDRIVSGIRQIYNVTFQVTFPHSSLMALNNRPAHQQFLKKVRLGLAAVYLGVIIVTQFTADWIILLFTKAEDPFAAQLLRVEVLMPLIVGLGIKAYQNILIYDFRKLYSSIFVVATLVSLAMTTVLTLVFGAYGTAASMLLTELMVTGALVYFDRQRVSHSW